MTYTAWRDLDSVKITEPRGAEDALKKNWRPYNSHGGRSIATWFGPTKEGRAGAQRRE